jgi:glutamate carboxypeptidase
MEIPDPQSIRVAARQRYQADLDCLLSWASINSGTQHLEGNLRMLQEFATRANILPGTGAVTTLSDSVPSRAARPQSAVYRHHCREHAPIQILLNGHVDTVFDANHPFQSCTWLEGGTLLQGPGVADMKGGLVILLAALELFESLTPASIRQRLGWEILINCDEETGSTTSRETLIEAAKRNHLGITFESALPDGYFVRQRMGVGQAHAVVHGRSAHAGRNFHEGRNAIVKLSEWITCLHALNEEIPGIIINTGSIRGGGPT